MKKTITVLVTIVFLNITYINIDPSIVINELYNSILQNNNATQEIYKIHNIICEYKLHIKHNTTTQIVFTTENITINTNIHIKNMHMLLTSMFSIGATNIIYIKIKAILYRHELEKIRQMTYMLITISTLLILYYMEIIANTLIKKNFNSTEILNTTNTIFALNEYITSSLIIIIYYIITSKKDMHIKNTKHKTQTKYIICILYIICINIYAQYSLNESLLLLLSAEIIYQLKTIYKCLNKNVNTVLNKHSQL